MFLESAMYFLIVITLLVFIHELGHFASAKFFKMRVDVFSIGMGPRAFGFKKGDTDYRVSYFPIGGYVKIAGMIDESMDTDFVNSEPQPWEYRSKPRWQRSIVISAGVIMNLIAAGLIFSFLYFKNGKTLLPFDSSKPISISSNSALYDLGMRSGDQLIKINNQPIKYYSDIVELEEITNANLNFTIKRDGKEQVLHVPDNFLSDLEGKELGIGFQFEPVIGVIVPGSAAEKNGLLAGDKIVSINDHPITYFEDIPQYLQNEKVEDAKIVYLRENQPGEVFLKLENHRIGIGPKEPNYERVDYSIAEATIVGFSSIGSNLTGMINGFVKIFQGKEEASKAIGGPIKIFQLSGQTGAMGWETFMRFMALISLSLALMNILPIPALDGGHLFILIIESVARRDLSYKLKMNIQQAGFALLIGFMVFAVYNDVMNLF